MNKLKLAHNCYIARKEPVQLIHFVTNHCNARCKHCFIDFANPETFRGFLSLEEIEKLTKSLGKSLFNVNLTGGEPFLRKDIFEIAKLYLTNTTIESLFISTNGFFTEFTQDFIKKFQELKTGKKLLFSISIDNFQEAHDENRKLKGLYKRALDSYHAIMDFNDPNIVANIGITVTHHNYDKALQVYEHLKKEGVRSFAATLMREEGVVKTIDPEMKKKLLDSYVALSNAIHQDQKKGTVNCWGGTLQGSVMEAKNMIMNRIIPDIYINNTYVAPCHSGALFGVIYANGDVYPCEILNDKKLGNLRDFDMNFMDLWNSKPVKECRSFIHDTKCTCTFECAWSINIISNAQFFPELAIKTLGVQWKK
ncbi:radical SAM protein [Candidatus Woesearchaeota archaeon]|nr:MAG: radical SAM protein [archaeon GW2011_AR4]MBS3129476.1 radical SAM protein [Candidatus Woesearchaeota archaeon]HIJ03763.1 radical SAM protein [Candidatus Woesearchaeota archaeon]